MPSTRPFISFLFGNLATSTTASTPSTGPSRQASAVTLQKHVQHHSHHRQGRATGPGSSNQTITGTPTSAPLTTISPPISTTPSTAPQNITGPIPLHGHARNTSHVSSPPNKTNSGNSPGGFETVLATSPQPSSLGASPPPTSFTPDYNTNERRNSACSLTSDKWWIGGKSSDGSERYYRLQPLSSHRSFDRISLDRLSI